MFFFRIFLNGNRRFLFRGFNGNVLKIQIRLIRIKLD